MFMIRCNAPEFINYGCFTTMSRDKAKLMMKENVSKTMRNNQNKPDMNKVNNSEGAEIKTEPPELPEEKPSSSEIDLNQFKFEKKPHVKIEYDSDSTVKVEKPKGIWTPLYWKEFLVNLRIMRANRDAPVDTMGCHMSMDQDTTPETMRYQCLISLMLSSQTKDEVTFSAMERLRARGLTIDNVLNMSDDELGRLIYPVGFWKTKVQYIKKTTLILKEQYNGDVPDTAEKLCKLRGVGPKMAHLCMLIAWDKVTGIGVDTHVHRISNRIGWVKKPTNTPEETRKALESWLPFDLWKEVNLLLVGFGQTICTPINPNCSKCLNKAICPSSFKVKKSPKKTVIEETKENKITDNEFGDKPVKTRKVTPRKELNGENSSHNTVNKSPRNKKVTPKKETNANVSEISNVKVEGTKKSLRKRKVVSNEGKQESSSDDDIDDFEVKKESQNKETKKKVTPNKSNKNIKAHDDFVEPSSKTMSKSKTRTHLDVEDLADDKDKSKLPVVQKKSPRNKVKNTDNVGDSSAVMKRTKDAKKS